MKDTIDGAPQRVNATQTLGLYSLLAYVVALRRHEMAVRLGHRRNTFGICSA